MKLLLTVAFTMLFSIVFGQPYLVGDRVDIYTNDGKYYPATVLELAKDQLKVRYVGFGAESDAWVKENNVVRGGSKGDKIIVMAASATFQGTIEEVIATGYKVKYEGYPESYTLTRSQFNFMSSPEESRKNNAQNSTAPSTQRNSSPVQTTQPANTTANGTYQPGTKLMGQEGNSWYAATVKEFANGKYRVKWDNYNYEAWLTPAQLKLKPTLPADKARATNGKMYLRSMRWIATGYTELSWFFLGDNGLIVVDPKFGSNPVNPALEQSDNDNNVGVYTVGNGTLDVKWLNGKTTAYGMKTRNGEIIELDAGGIMVRQKGMPENYKLNGTYKGSISFAEVSSSATYTFLPDGTVSVNYTGTAAQGRAEKSMQGKYYIKGTNLLMSFADGTKINANVGIFDGADNNNIVINKTWLTKM